MILFLSQDLRSRFYGVGKRIAVGKCYLFDQTQASFDAECLPKGEIDSLSAQCVTDAHVGGAKPPAGCRTTA
jgi:hypothetical protein